MKHVIIGTAGHVDHGKTLLVKALTGIDTDRLPEEKKRGVTIELGFAHLDLGGGAQAGIVDVPGHEKFIKNMLSGAGGIDLAMLVVAADEGFMPQTAEHLDILTLLGIRDGLVVITKTDLVDPDWLGMVQEDVRKRIRGTFLEGKPILPVSAYTGEGVEDLRRQLGELVKAAAEKDLRTPFRLPIDRVFSVDGFGTVVTGTLIEGCLREDDAVQLTPSGSMSKARSLQVHGQNVPAAYAGQRVAVNLAGMKKTDIRRGDTLAKPQTVRISRMLDVRLKNLPSSRRIILNGSQVHLYHGSRVELAKIVLLDRDELHPGQDCYAQLRLAEPMATKNGDRFVIRFYSPLETIGGGVILDDMPRKHKRNDKNVLEELKIKESGSAEERICQLLTESGLQMPNAVTLAVSEDLLMSLAGCGKIIEALPGRYLSAAVLDKLWESCREILESYHRRNPLHEGMRLAELRQKLLPGTERMAADAVLQALEAEGKIRRVADRYALQDFAVVFTKKQKAIREKLLQRYKDAGLEAPSVDEVRAEFDKKDAQDVKMVLESMVSGGGLVMLNSRMVWHVQTYETALAMLRDWFSEQETLTLAQFRDFLGTSRAYALEVLEYFDKIKITQKDGDFRRWAAPS